MDTKRQRPFLKWAGGKYNLVPELLKHFTETDTLVEPFVGAGAVFLNTHYKKYILNDLNPDLINVYTTLQREGQAFIDALAPYFLPNYNTEAKYYALRERFNSIRAKTLHARETALLFVYLNRHCFNGLCRYNGSNQFNVPFGRYKQPYFPEAEMAAFHKKSQMARFTNDPFETVFKQTNRRKPSLIYCDPPYVPLSRTAQFTSYVNPKFNDAAQVSLARHSEHSATKGHTVVISNHDTPYTRKLYEKAKIKRVHVPRFINVDPLKRKKATEVIAIYTPA